MSNKYCRVYTEEDDAAYFACCIIEDISRKTNQHKKDILNLIGKEGLSFLLDYADILHCDTFDETSETIIERYSISKNILTRKKHFNCKVPTITEISTTFRSVYLRLNGEPYERFHKMYNSLVCDKIDDYNCSMYYENPDYIVACIEANELLIY